MKPRQSAVSESSTSSKQVSALSQNRHRVGYPAIENWNYIIMALKQNTKSVAATPFESEDDTGIVQALDAAPAVETKVKVAKKEVETVEVDEVIDQPVTSTEVAVKTSSALSAPAKPASSRAVMDSFKDELRVEFNELPMLGIKPGLGEFIVKESKDKLGKEIFLALESFQDAFVVSPNDDDAAAELVKYSDDGITCKDGTDAAEHLADLKDQGYAKAKITHRLVLVGEYRDTNSKGEDLKGGLVQIDLSETGRTAFNSYKLQAAFKIAKGRMTLDQSRLITLKAVGAETKDGKSYAKASITATA